MDRQKLQQRFDELSCILLDEFNPKGFWEGELSSSALGVAVAIAALHFHNREKHQLQIQKGLGWLCENVNTDGGFGDTPDSPGNVSTSLLVYAAANLYVNTNSEVAILQQKVAQYLSGQQIDVKSSQVSRAILSHYQKDYTFSVPILTMCGLCGVPDKNAFKHIPQLPFELSLVPRQFYRMLKLSVVSYAIPALIAVGIVIYKNKLSVLGRMLRGWAVKPAIRLLTRIKPASGGFLEAIPLTAFVCLSLIESGYQDTDVVEKGIGFLLRTQREDGSWAIDVDLSTWVSTLSVKALRSGIDDLFTPEMNDKLASHFINTQNKVVHSFNGTRPGGWGWTHHSGSVPDGDDTPGVVLALLQLRPAEQVQTVVLDGCNWLMLLQNKDGGFPTFSKGWGRLPFDRSCADLTGHCLLAFSACIETYGYELKKSTLKKYKRSFNRALNYLNVHQLSNGSWLPLWFGNQQAPDQSNPVYGTAKVLSYLKDSSAHQWIEPSVRHELSVLIAKGEGFLLAVQNEDGSWGGDKNIVGTIEETALAVTALRDSENTISIGRGIEWLDDSYSGEGLKASPIGLYFASLWYSEKMYPLTLYLEALSVTLGA